MEFEVIFYPLIGQKLTISKGDGSILLLFSTGHFTLTKAKNLSMQMMWATVSVEIWGIEAFKLVDSWAKGEEAIDADKLED